jgi:hypothetical protein
MSYRLGYTAELYTKLKFTVFINESILLKDFEGFSQTKLLTLLIHKIE